MMSKCELVLNDFLMIIACNHFNYFFLQMTKLFNESIVMKPEPDVAIPLHGRYILLTGSIVNQEGVVSPKVIKPFHYFNTGINILPITFINIYFFFAVFFLS